MDAYDAEDLDFELDDDQEFFGSKSEFEADIDEELESENDNVFELEDDFEGSVFEDLSYELPPGADYQVIFDPNDTRKRITNTRAVPWRHIVKISPPGCTGTLIAPNKVLTAAHCVYNRSRNSPYSGIRVIPGKSGSSEPFGSARAIRVNYPKAYARASSYAQAWPHDYAVITLDKPIGRTTGHWTRMAALPARKLRKVKLNTAGYPGDKGGQHLYWTFNRVSHVRGSRIEYLHDTAGGQSGSPVWLKTGSRRILVAVHTARDNPATPVVANRGVALTGPILRRIRAWMRS
jgi:glutamyl endopeptidase